MTIPERIKYRRIELGMSQTELAKKVGYSGKTAISKIECGERQLRQSMIVKIADALETTPSYIMGWDEAEEEVKAFYKAMIDAFKRADPVTQDNICLLLRIKKPDDLYII